MKFRYAIPFIVILIFFSCSQPEESSGYEPYDTHPYWTDSTPDAFWDKQPDGGFLMDTVWDNDTTIYF